MIQRHSPGRLFWRGVIAACGNAAMVAGAYPILPHAGAAWLEWRRGRSPRSPHLRAAATEWAASMFVSAARPVGFLGLPVSVRHRRGPRPIVVLHGYAMSRANFLLLARRLRRAGLGPIFGFEYWTLGRVAGAAKRLGAFVEEVCFRTGAPRVDVIGHSMGGVVGRYYVSLGGGAPRVRNLVTIGSPHGGTPASMFGIGRPTRELRPGSTLLARLAAAPVPQECRLTVIWSRADPLVGTARSARAPGGEELVFGDLGHLSLLMSRRIARAIADRLGGDVG